MSNNSNTSKQLTLERKLQSIYEVTVSPVSSIVWNDVIMDRYWSLENTQVFKRFNDNLEKLVSKIPKLKQFKQLMNRKANVAATQEIRIIPWIKKWFNNNTFSETSIIHSVPERLQELTKISHNITLLYAINNKNVIMHGSFISYLENPKIKYADIDLSCLADELVFITSFILYIFMDIETHVLSIPYIINHRQLRKNGENISICDALKIDLITLIACQTTSVKYSNNLYINIQHPAMQFFNYFKMISVAERRMKMRHYKDNQMMILSTITKGAMDNLGVTVKMMQQKTIGAFNVLCELQPNDVILMTLTWNNVIKRVYFYNKLTDDSFIDNVIPGLLNKAKANGDNTLTYVYFNQMGSAFPEQRIDVITAQGIGFETHINLSRNDVYKILTSETTSTISVMTMLAIYGLHAFFTRTYPEAGVEDFVRVFVTIIEMCDTMHDMNDEKIITLYGRTKNTGEHIVRNIRSKNIYLPNVNNTAFGFLTALDSNGGVRKSNKAIDIEDYINLVKQVNKE